MTSAKQPVAVLGGGSFGSVIAHLLATNGWPVQLWLRDEKKVTHIHSTGFNPKYLPHFKLHSQVSATTDLRVALTPCQLVFIAIPSEAMRSVARQIAPLLNARHLLVSTSKGIEKDSFMLMSQILQQETGCAQIGVLSGPNLAGEIAQGHLTGTVIASTSIDLCRQVQGCLTTPQFRIYASPDVFGVELAGVLKNIYAIAAGMIDALGMGENTKSMFITRSLAEMSRLAVTLGANPMTFLGLAGVGDLLVTCFSRLSRNYRVGEALAEGKSLQQAVAELGQVAEGVNTLAIVKQKADQLKLTMPLATSLYKIVFEQHSPQEVIAGLINDAEDDVEFMAT
jgi:glycerol-3-phosphate dehydrogenase (NAD(P)+)